MAIHNNTGQQGEQQAVAYLKEHGYTILSTNWRLGHLEADIIALKGDIVAFVEVKTRSSVDFGSPESFVDRKKQQACRKLANAYVKINRRYEEVRFDIISVMLGDHGWKINHIEAAFKTF